MAAAAGYTIAASYQDIHPAGSAVIFLAIFLLPLLLVRRFRSGLLAWSASALAFPLFYLSWWLFGTAHHPEATHLWDSTVALACAAPPLLAALALRRLPEETLLKRSAILCFYYGAAIGMLTLAIGLQWTGAPLTVAWSLEGAGPSAAVRQISPAQTGLDGIFPAGLPVRPQRPVASLRAT